MKRAACLSIPLSVLLSFINLTSVCPRENGSGDLSKHIHRYLVQFEDRESYTLGHAKIVKSDRLQKALPNHFVDIMNLEVSEVNDWRKHLPGVIHFEKDKIFRSPKQPFHDTSRHMQDSDIQDKIPYGIKMMNTSLISQEFISNRKICVIDSGYDISHPDLPSNVTGKSFVDGLDWKVDVDGHGTHVAGIIAALGGNKVGVVGVLSTGHVQLHIARAIDDKGNAFESDLVAAFEHCADVGAHIINYSGGASLPSAILESVVNRLYEERDVLIFCAAGNYGPGSIAYPAFYRGAISVGSIDANKTISLTSATNMDVELMGPGVDVYSTSPGNTYSSLTGTSMACPHVAAVTALIWSHFPARSAKEMRRYLQISAQDLGETGRDTQYGFGLVNADKAFYFVANNVTLIPTVTPTQSPSKRSCSDNEVSIIFDFVTDGYGQETGWELIDLNRSEMNKVIRSGSGYASKTFYSYDYCLKCSSYQLRLLDNYGDGMDGGDYRLEVDQETTVFKMGTDFGYEDVMTFIPKKCETNELIIVPNRTPTRSSANSLDHKKSPKQRWKKSKKSGKRMKSRKAAVSSKGKKSRKK